MPKSPLTRLPELASLFLVVAIGAVLARFTWQLAPVGVPPEAVAPAVEPTATEPGDSRREGLGVALFGTAASAPGQATEVPLEAPPTRLDLKLRGVALARGGSPSLAIIEGSDRESLPYREGDALPGNAELLRIEADRVILSHAGEAQALYFSDERPPPAATRARSPAQGASGGAIRLSPESSTRVRTYLSQLPADPTRMVELVRALPVMENGQLRGFRLFPGRERELFGEAGLRRGDIATSINGMPLDDPARGMELLNQLASASRFQIDILRRGQPQVLEIEL